MVRFLVIFIRWKYALLLYKKTDSIPSMSVGTEEMALVCVFGKINKVISKKHHRKISI